MGVPEERDDSETCGKADGDAPHAPQAPVRADWLHAYVVWLQRWKLAVVAFWIALLVVGIIGVTRVFPALRLLVRATCDARCARVAASHRSHAGRRPRVACMRPGER